MSSTYTPGQKYAFVHFEIPSSILKPYFTKPYIYDQSHPNMVTIHIVECISIEESERIKRYNEKHGSKIEFAFTAKDGTLWYLQPDAGRTLAISLDSTEQYDERFDEGLVIEFEDFRSYLADLKRGIGQVKKCIEKGDFDSKQEADEKLAILELHFEEIVNLVEKNVGKVTIEERKLPGWFNTEIELFDNVESFSVNLQSITD